jgi:hypothetical protein
VEISHNNLYLNILVFLISLKIVRIEETKMNHIKLILKFTIIIAYSFVNVSSAGVISGNQSTDDGNLVALQGYEWMTLDSTAGLQRSDIENGFTDNDGNVWGASDWSYASRVQTEILVNSLWDGIYSGWSDGNFDGASWFIENFGGLGFEGLPGGVSSNSNWVNLDNTRFFFGDDGDCTSDLSMSCRGYIQAGDNYNSDLSARNVVTSTASEVSYIANSGGVGFLSESNGSDMGFSTYNDTLSKTTADSRYGSLLLRSVPLAIVPEPSTMFIFALGIMGLVSGRFKK